MKFQGEAQKESEEQLGTTKIRLTILTEVVERWKLLVTKKMMVVELILE